VPSFGLTHPGVLLLRNRDTGLGHLAGSPFMQTVRMRNCGQIELRILSIWWRCNWRCLTWNAHGKGNLRVRLICKAWDFKPELHCTLLVPVRNYRLDQLRVVIRMHLDDPNIVLIRFRGNLLGVVRFGILDEDDILQPADEHELIEGAGPGLRTCWRDQSKRVSLPEVAVPIGFEPDRHLIIGRRKVKG